MQIYFNPYKKTIFSYNKPSNASVNRLIFAIIMKCKIIWLMKKFGLWLLKNNIHIMTLIFLGWVLWGICNWQNLQLVQKLTLGMYAWLIVHEYEEGYKGKFLDLMAGRLLQIDHRTLTPGMTHIGQAVYITVLFSLALLFPNHLWLTFGALVLGIFEGFVHNMGIFLFQLKGVSPGWYTAVLMAAYAIWAIVVINRNIDYPGIQWLWGILWFLFGFMCLEISVHYLMGSTPKKSLGKAKLFLKDRFGK